MPSVVPPWIEIERGSSPILLLAPHGGRRHGVRIPGRHKVNDLRTADVTRELAAVLGAARIVNERVDRNELDLNRLAQVRRDAPWLLGLMAELLGEIVATAGRATVLVIHGWNVSQVACDVGVGMCESGDGLVALRPRSATVGSAFVSRLRHLQLAAEAEDIAVTIGSRYPAAHPNNLLQVFGSDDPADGECPIASLRRRAAIDAAQLELAIPLRWPGAYRQRFVGLLADTFAGADVADSASLPVRYARGRALRAGTGRVTRRRSLQLVADDLLLMTGMEAGESGMLAGRVVVSEAASRLSLFTGELADPARTWTIPPLVCEGSLADGLRFAFDGPLVTFPTHTPFVDLERGLADGTVVAGSVDLTFERDAHAGDADECFGIVRGELVVDGRRHVLATPGFATSAERPAPLQFRRCRITLLTGPWGALAFDESETAVWHDGRLHARLVGTGRNADGAVAMRATADIHLGRDAGSIEMASIGMEGGSTSLSGMLERLLPVHRPGPAGSVIETTFAIIRADGRSVGWVEASVVRPASDVSD